MKKVLLLIAAVLMLTFAAASACAEKATVMMYMCGSDIYEDCLNDMGEITKATSGSDVTVAVLAGGTKTWGDRRLTDGAVNRFTIQNGAWSAVQNAGTANMGSADTLAGFIDSCIEQYPADRYILILWDHGGGAVSGICFDQMHDDDSLSVAELSDALAKVRSAHPDFHLDILGEDACMMATYEMAAVASSCADYYVASEETEPWLGWYYGEWVASLCRDPGIAARDLAIEIVDSYRVECEAKDPNELLTMSAIDLSKMSALTQCVNELAEAVTAQLNTDYATLSRTFSSLYIFGSGDNAGSDSVDMSDFITACAAYDRDAADRAKAALNDAVLYSYHNSSVPSAQGLAIFIPMENAQYYGELSSDYETEALGSYPRLVSAMASAASGTDGITTLETPQQLDTEDMSTDNDFIVTAYDYSYDSTWNDWNWDESEWGWYDEDGNWWSYGYGGDYGTGYSYGSGFGSNGENCGYDTSGQTDQLTGVTGYIGGSAVEGENIVIAGSASAVASGIVIAGSSSQSSGESASSAGIVIAGQSPSATPTPAPVSENASSGIVIAGLSTPAPAVTAAPSVNIVIAGSGSTEETPADSLNVTVPAAISQSVAYSLSLTDEEMADLAYAEAVLICDWSDETGYDYEMMGLVRDTWVSWDGNTVYTLFDGSWPSIDGIYVPMYDQTVTDTTRRSLIPILLNGTERTDLVVRFDAGSDEGIILGTCEGLSENGMSTRGITPLNIGDTFTPVYTDYTCATDVTPELANMTASETSYTDADFQITWDGTQTVKFDSLSDAEYVGNYLIGFRLHDVAGGVTDTALTAAALPAANT